MCTDRRGIVLRDDIMTEKVITGSPAGSSVPKMFVSFNRDDIAVSQVYAGEVRSGELTNIIGANFCSEKIRVCASKYAIVVLFYGNNTEVLAQTLVMGYQLRTKHRNDKVDICVMIVGESHKWILKLLSVFFTILKVSDISPGNSSWVKGMNAKSSVKWKSVWSKLWAWDLTQYNKVILLDVDMLVRDSLMDYFTLPTPAGSIWSKQLCFNNGDVIPKSEMIAQNPDGSPYVKFHINAGFLIVSPNKQEFDDFINWITNDINVLTDGKMPEQEALSTFFQWHAVRDNFNIGFLRSRFRYEREDIGALSLAMGNSKIIHFPGKWTIRNYLNWKLDRSNELPCQPHVKVKERFEQLFMEYINFMDLMYLDPHIHNAVKEFVIFHYDPRKDRSPKKSGQFSFKDQQGVALFNEMKISQSVSLEICFAYNQQRCNNKECHKLHVCRGPKCGFAKHKFCNTLCRYGRPNFHEHAFEFHTNQVSACTFIGGTIL